MWVDYTFPGIVFPTASADAKYLKEDLLTMNKIILNKYFNFFKVIIYKIFWQMTEINIINQK